MYSKPAAPLTHLHNINRARRMAAKKRSKKAVFGSVKHFNSVSRRPDPLQEFYFCLWFYQ